MTPEQVAALGPAFAAYLRDFEDCFGQDRTREHLHAYCRGLLSDLPRKSVEPIALAAGTAVRTLQEFLKDHVWDRRALRDRLHRRVSQSLAAVPADDLGTVGLLDETSVVKKGKKTPGVQRQYCGAVGKQENCIVTVHLGVAKGGYKALLDADLFLPQSWSDDRPRCREAGIPDDVTYQPKWRLGLGQIYRAMGNGIALDWLTFDEGYGCRTGFLAELDALAELRWVGEVPKSFRCVTAGPNGRKPGPARKGKRADRRAPQPGLLGPAVAAGDPEAADAGRSGVAGQGGAGASDPQAAGDGPHLLADRGLERGDGGGQVLRLRTRRRTRPWSDCSAWPSCAGTWSTNSGWPRARSAWATTRGGTTPACCVT